MIDPVLGLTLRVEGPVISQDSASPVFGFDAVMLKDGCKAVLPGTQIKGLLREIFELAIEQEAPGLDQAWLSEWFGTGSGAMDGSEEQSYEPKTGRLLIADLTADPAQLDEAITRVALDHKRGSVKEGMLQSIETPWGYGDVAKFIGEARVRGAVDAATLALLKTRLEWAFKLIPAVGAFKTAGFGRLLGAETGEWATLFRPPDADDTPSGTGGTDGSPATVSACDILDAGGADFDLHPKESFVVWPVSFGGNFFAGDTVIPGQVLKAVAARWLSDRGLLAGKEVALASLVFRHARPIPEGAPKTPPPVTKPLSTYHGVKDDGVTSGDDEECLTGDVLDDECLFNYASGEYAMAFQPDWKGVPAEYGHEERLGRVARTRTAIGAGGVAEDERLFTHVAVDPKGFVWRVSVLIPPGTDPKVAATMAELLANLNGSSLGLGKTKVPLTWSPTPLGPRPHVPRPKEGNWRVVLQTPACLHGPARTRSTKKDPITALREDYTTYWKSVLGKGARLVDFMAQQRLAGGYLARRYPVAPCVGFEPYLLTQPGSIFVIAASEDRHESEIEEKLKEVAIAGLPLSGCWPRNQRSWKTHPFLPEAGWGEIRINEPMPQEHPR